MVKSKDVFFQYRRPGIHLRPVHIRSLYMDILVATPQRVLHSRITLVCSLRNVCLLPRHEATRPKEKHKQQQQTKSKQQQTNKQKEGTKPDCGLFLHQESEIRNALLSRVLYYQEYLIIRNTLSSGDRESEIGNTLLSGILYHQGYYTIRNTLLSRDRESEIGNTLLSSGTLCYQEYYIIRNTIYYQEIRSQE